MTFPARLARLALAAGAALAVAAPGLPASAQLGDLPAPGSAGVGDPYFPLDGNGGIDVGHYDIKVRYDFATGRLRGVTRLTLTPTTELSRFNLDLLLPARSVTVDGVRAEHRARQGHELVVTPRQPLEAAEPVEVRVSYAGRPGSERYAGSSSWLADDHEVVTMNEPHMAPWWFAANDHPSDKATYSVAVTVPRGRQVVSNGDLVGRTSRGGSTTWRWRAREPMTSYLAFFAAGRFELDRGTAAGRPWLVAASRQLAPAVRRSSMRQLRRTPRLVRWLESQLGAYPFSSSGGLVTALEPGFALENQTRPTYPPLWSGSTGLLVHELAHQWFGNSVSVARWRDIWLNEGAATFMEVRHTEATGGEAAQDWLVRTHDAIRAGSPFWDVRIADPGRGKIFDWAVYLRGAMTFQALRHRIGEQHFWALLRTWLDRHADGNATSEQFEALAEEVSGQDLTAFFQAWLREPTRPGATLENGLLP